MRFRLARLRELYSLTARAFDKQLPDIEDIVLDSCLASYAAFTRDAARDAIADKRDMDEIKARLYHAAREFGFGIRKSLHVRGPNQARVALRILYRGIGIELKCNHRGNITVSRCYFSDFYDARICDIVSALDDGLAAGLTDGGLEFSQRITEGHRQCQARLTFGKKGL
jgi:hypothetical protein